MLNSKKSIAGIRSFSPRRERWVAKRPEDLPEKLTVSFETGETGILDLTYPLAVVWANMLDHLHRNNRPAYVEIDSETKVIIQVYIPEAAQVRSITPEGQGHVYVIFHTSAARHYLRRSHPDFETMLASLEAARDSNTTILVTSTYHNWEIIDVRALPTPFGRGSPPGPPPAPAPDPPVDPVRAQQLFDLMNARSCVPCSATSPCIPFKYPPNGCWARAHEMCRLMMEEGETPEKVWINGNLLALTSNVPECHVDWGWHVAPTLMVTQPSGPDIKMVIDPSLSTTPVTPEDWKALQGDPNATLDYTGWENYFQESGTDNDFTQTEEDLERFRGYLNALCEQYGPSPYACPIVKGSFFIMDRNNFSDDEIEAMLHQSSTAVIEAAFYVVVDGFSPEELGFSSAAMERTPALGILPDIPGMSIEVDRLEFEYPAYLERPQRLTWVYRIRFSNTSGFTSERVTVTLNASLETVACTGYIYLIQQPNPYEIDGETAWLSIDLRVFQINSGETKFGMAMGSDANAFITQVTSNLNQGNAGGQTFEDDISTDHQTSRLELSQSVGGTAVYNFAVAKVRYRARTVSATDVRVFFRLFPYATTSLAYDQATTYRRHEQGDRVIPLLGIRDGETAVIPCFARPRVDSAATPMTMQIDPDNVLTMPPNGSGAEVVRYFGCWLDINQTQPQFPIQPSPVNGPWPTGRVSIKDLIRNEHQCLVSEIAFTPAPAQGGSTPSVSDKLAQRNLAIVETANPGVISSRRVPQTFEIRPSHSKLEPDELMIDWGEIPVGSQATIYLPGIDTNDILRMASKKYRAHRLVRIDKHTLTCETGGITYVPIPFVDGSFPGLLTVDLPAGIESGQVFTIVVRQVTGEQLRLRGSSTGPKPIPRLRYIVGSFQITIPVREKAAILAKEERLLSNLRWTERAIPADNRWFSVFGRYVKQVADRVDALGGNSKKVAASPSGEWQDAYRKCFTLAGIAALLTALFLVCIGSLRASLLAVAGIVILALLVSVVRYWIKSCRPVMCRLLRALMAGAGLGAIVLALLLIFGPSSVKLIITLIFSAALAAVAVIIGWVKGCFGR